MNIRVMCKYETLDNNGEDYHDNYVMIPLKEVNYPAGEVGILIGDVDHPQFMSSNKWFEIRADIYTANDLVSLCGVIRHLSTMGCIERIDIGYMAFGRQDKVKDIIRDGEKFTEIELTKTTLNLLFSTVATIVPNQGNYDPIITILDPHTEIGMNTGKYDNLLVSNRVEINQVTNLFPQSVIIFPDEGAYKRYEYLLKTSKHRKYLIADKKRDDNGKIVDYVLHGLFNEDDDYVVIDDICDGGATFLILGKTLKERGHRGKLNLQVTHGLFTKGKEELYNYYDEIICVTELNNE